MVVDFVQMGKGKPMLKVPYGQDPYSVIGKYIQDHITAIEDIIAVIKIDEDETNQLFMVDMNEEDYFIWETDWWEGEKDVTLIDFFPVSEAINPSAQSEIVRCKDCKHHHYDSGIPYCDRIDYGYGWKDDDFCSRAQRITDEGGTE